MIIYKRFVAVPVNTASPFFLEKIKPQQITKVNDFTTALCTRQHFASSLRIEDRIARGKEQKSLGNRLVIRRETHAVIARTAIATDYLSSFSLAFSFFHY